MKFIKLFIIIFFCCNGMHHAIANNNVRLIKDFSNQLFIFDQEGHLIPYVNAIHTGSHSVGFWLHYHTAKGNYLKIPNKYSETKKLSFFINGVLYDITDSLGFVNLNQIPNLHHTNDSVFVMFFHPNGFLPLNPTIVRIQGGAWLDAQNAQTIATTTKRNLSTISATNVFKLMLFFALMAPFLFIRTGGKVHSALVKPLVFNTDNYIIQFTKVGVRKVFQYVLVNIIIIVTVNSLLDGKTEFSFLSIFNTILLVSLTFLSKFAILVFADMQFDFKGLSRQHFLEFQKWILSVGLVLLLTIILSESFQGIDLWFLMKKIKLIGFILVLFLIINVYRLINYKNRFSRLFFISYICITELLPLAVFYKIAPGLF